MKNTQFVCTVCGYNMIGYCPHHCPFCGVSKDHFITAEECSNSFRVSNKAIHQNVTRLNSSPALGLEHAAYQIETNKKVIWIDCPSSFDQNVTPPDIITFTHHHFLGACNLYKDHFSALVRIHTFDAVEELCRGYTFDDTFEFSHRLETIEAFHINGHTGGFTFYLFEDVLFICDYLFLKDETMSFNPYGPHHKTLQGGKKLLELITDRKITTVAGYNYVTSFPDWFDLYNELLHGENAH